MNNVPGRDGSRKLKGMDAPEAAPSAFQCILKQYEQIIGYRIKKGWGPPAFFGQLKLLFFIRNFSIFLISIYSDL